MAPEILSPLAQTSTPCGAWLEVSLDRIQRNLERIREKTGPATQVMAVVKSNAYGHGLVPIARALEGKADLLGIGSLHEAYLLREQGITSPLFLFGRIFPEELASAFQRKVILTVSSLEEAEMLSEAAPRFSQKVRIHIKIDTGMGRLGIPYAQAFSEIQEIAKLPALQLDGIYTHFPSAEKYSDPFTEKQLSYFEKLIRDLEAIGIAFPYRHATNSAGAIRLKNSRLNLIRPGLALYGIYPDPSFEKEIVLEPALSFKTRIVFLKHLSAGDSTGYGREFVAAGPTNIAVLSAGYAHGYPFQLSKKAEVLYRGKRFRIAGKVCMDSMMIDLGSLTEARIGEEVVLLGAQGEDQIHAAELARLAQTIPYEIVTRLDARLPRFYR